MYTVKFIIIQNAYNQDRWEYDTSFHKKFSEKKVEYVLNMFLNAK